MHEISIVENIIKIVVAEMPKHNITKVDSIKLRIGDMSHIVPEALTFGFEVMSDGTALEGAKIIIENVPTKGRCKQCGHEFEVEDWLENCPKCEKMDVEIISGKELDIVEFSGS